MTGDWMDGIAISEVATSDALAHGCSGMDVSVPRVIRKEPNRSVAVAVATAGWTRRKQTRSISFMLVGDGSSRPYLLLWPGAVM